MASLLAHKRMLYESVRAPQCCSRGLWGGGADEDPPALRRTPSTEEGAPSGQVM